MGQFLRKNTAVIVTVGPFYDKTDGVTIETGLTITNERITLVADTDDGSAPTIILDNVTGATSGTDNDLNYITNCDAGLMQLELTAANTNRNGRLTLTITDAANHVPVFHVFEVLDAAVYDSLVLGTDKLAVDAQEISSDSVAADNLESGFDGAGYAGGTTKQVVEVNTKTGFSLAADQSGVTIGTVNALAAGAVASIWNALTAGMSTAGSIGKRVVDYLDAAVSSRSTYAGADTAGTTTLLGRILGTLAAGTHNPQSGDAFARLGVNGAGLTALGDARLANLDATVSSRSTYAGVDTAGTTTLLSRIVGTLLAGNHNPQSGDAYAEAVAVHVHAATAETQATEANAHAHAIDNRLPSDPADQSVVEAAIIAAVAPLATSVAVADVPTVAEFEARTIPSANYALDATVAKAATALSNAIWTNAKAGYLTGNVALEATLTAIKGAGWTTETLVAFDALLDAIKIVTDKLNTAVELDGGVYRYTANALEEAPAGGAGMTAQEVRDAMKLAPTAGAPAAGSVDAHLDNIPTTAAPTAAAIDAQLSATHGAGIWGSSAGVFSVVYTVTVSGVPRANVYCRMTADLAGAIPVDAGYTNALGQVTFHHSFAAGTTVYIWRTLAGIEFSDPDVEVIP